MKISSGIGERLSDLEAVTIFEMKRRRKMNVHEMFELIENKYEHFPTPDNFNEDGYPGMKGYSGEFEPICEKLCGGTYRFGSEECRDYCQRVRD